MANIHPTMTGLVATYRKASVLIVSEPYVRGRAYEVRVAPLDGGRTFPASVGSLKLTGQSMTPEEFMHATEPKPAGSCPRCGIRAEDHFLDDVLQSCDWAENRLADMAENNLPA